MCRGVVISEGLGSLNDHESVVMVPQSLVIDTDVARAGLSTVLSSQSIEKVSPSLHKLISKTSYYTFEIIL
jgi:hypothetical protein